jgi:DNA-binding CsgD family transcriptional regulator
MKKLCDQYGIDFEKAVTDFNQTYNEGYKKLGKSNVVRPVLFPPKGGCGGHCVLENTILLREACPEFMEALDFILSMGKDKKYIPEEKPYFNKTWLYAEYWGKGKTSREIARELGCSGENILHIMERRKIPRRDLKWTEKQLDKILKLSEAGKTFKEIAEELEKDKRTYDAVRNVAYKILKIKSSYNPAASSKNEEIRQKISASLQGIELEDWDGFKEDINSLIRKSVAYQKWRERIFESDNYTCQKCKEKGVYLVAHHIESFSRNPKFRMKMKNGITLCRECHLDFHNRYGRENNNKKQLKEYLK